MSDVMSSGKQNRTVLYCINDQAKVFPENRSDTSQASADSVATLMLYYLIQYLHLFSLY